MILCQVTITKHKDALYAHIGAGDFPSLVMDEVAQPQTDPIHNLLVLLKEQLAAMVRRNLAHLQVGCQLHPFLEQKVLLTDTHDLVTSCLDHNNALYMGLLLKNVWKLQPLQKTQHR